MNYTIESFDAEDNGMIVRFEDGSWAKVMLRDDMTEANVDELVMQFAPKPAATLPSFISIGQQRTAIEKADPVNPEDNDPQWLQDRKNAYGTAQFQLEYITENGLEAWQAEVASIKTQFPKVDE